MAASLSAKTISVLKSTAPVLTVHGDRIATRFYDILFEKHPEARDSFNMSHHRQSQETGVASLQARAISSAVVGFAQHCDNLGALSDAVTRITEKHVSLDVRPEQYGVVGPCLLQAIKEVLGDAANEEIMTSWGEGYWYLANALIGIEKAKAEARKTTPGGWHGFKEMVVFKKEKESTDVTSFYFKNIDGNKLADDFKPGQYLSIRIGKEMFGDGVEFDMTRNYSMSCAPGLGHYRCSIKRDNSGDQTGMVSNYMHDHVNVNDKILVGMPCGHFTLEKHGNNPLVLVAAGVGVTPIMSILDYYGEQYKKGEKVDQKIICIQSKKSPARHLMKDHIDQLVGAGLTESHVFYTRDSGKTADLKNTKIHHGRMTLESIRPITEGVLDTAEFYFCGPELFMDHFSSILDGLNVPQNRRHYEYFGPPKPGM